MSGAVSLTVNFSTVSTSPTVTIVWPAHGLIVGNFVNIVVPVTIGGLVLLGFYTVATVPDGNTITITAAANATSTVNNAGAVPQFVATSGSSTITVNFATHGQTAGSTFNIQVQTFISDIVLFGSYIVQTVPNANSFTITAANPSLINTTVSENLGNAFMAGQNNAADPIDRLLYPLSETDYAAIPDKFQQGLPTSFFYNRQSPTPNVTLWLVPNNTGPYVLQFWRTRQLQDANLGFGQTPDIPYRFFEALCSDLAARLAQKFAPDRWLALKADAAAQWSEAALADSEKVSLYIGMQLDDYYN
jgi:hypothetical protein